MALRIPAGPIPALDRLANTVVRRDAVCASCATAPSTAVDSGLVGSNG